MGNQAMSEPMVNRTCEWVRARLPLLVGDRDDDHTGGDRDGGDLAALDRREIERHVRDCPSCRQHQAALENALGALAAAAAQMPVETEAPSLWPMLEYRIAHHDPRTPPRWLRATWGLAGRWGRASVILHEERAIHLAWMRDTLREALAGREAKGPESTRKPRLVLGSSLVAAILVALIGFPVLHRQWVEAQSTIVANAAPLADQVVPPQPIDEPSPGLASLDDDGEGPAGHLAETDQARASETPVSGPDGTLTPRPAPHIRFGYDLEHGTPMPPDTRESKPVY